MRPCSACCGARGLTVRRSTAGVIIVEPRLAPPLARQDVHGAGGAGDRRPGGARTPTSGGWRPTSSPIAWRRAAQIVDADRDNLDQFFRSRVPSDAIALPPSLDVKGETNSEIDLRGLGSNVDPGADRRAADAQRSRRHLRLPPAGPERRPPARHRAGGNPVRRRRRGSSASAPWAASSTSCSPAASTGRSCTPPAGSPRGMTRAQLTLEGRIAFTPDDGLTEVTLYAGGSRSEPLLSGRRGYLSHDTQLTADFAPQLLLGLRPNANSVFVSSSAGGSTLTFKPRYGGRRIPSSYSFIPAGLSGAARGRRGGARAERGEIRQRPLGGRGRQRHHIQSSVGGPARQRPASLRWRRGSLPGRGDALGTAGGT